MVSLWHSKERLILVAGLAFIVAMAWVCVVAVRPHWRSRPGEVGDEEPVASQPVPIPAALPGRDSSHPAPMEVPIAAIGQDNANETEANPVGVADVHPIDSLQAGQAPPAAPSDNQSDAEHLDMQGESSHAVAPVPVQDSSGAALAIRVASLGGLGVDGQGPVSASAPATKVSMIQLPLFAPAHHPTRMPAVVDLSNQTKVAHGQCRVFIVTAAATDWPAWMDSGWTLGTQLGMHWMLGRQFLYERQYQQSCGELIGGLHDLTCSVLQIACPTFNGEQR